MTTVEELVRKNELTAKIEPFDSFWEGPEDIEKGYRVFRQFYKSNYLNYMPQNRQAQILVISCGPGYFVNFAGRERYTSVLGIDSDPRKVAQAREKGLNCITARAFPFLEEHPEHFDLIFCESEINHLTKEEILEFLQLCKRSLRDGGTLIFHSMNGANPITGAEGLALNFDHYNTFTEYSLQQILHYTSFQNIRVIPLRLYVFYRNPLNYVGLTLDAALNFALRLSFRFYGKSNRLFSKKIAAVAHKIS